MISKEIYINPIGKPRMTQRDKWAKRPCVMRYRAFADELRDKVGMMPDDPSAIRLSIYIPMPKSWSKKKRDQMSGQPHRQKPDIDNICKAVMDSLLKDDSGIYAITARKVWDDGKGSRIFLEIN